MTPKEKEVRNQLEEKTKEMEENSQRKFSFRVRGSHGGMCIKKSEPIVNYAKHNVNSFYRSKHHVSSGAPVLSLHFFFLRY